VLFSDCGEPRCFQITVKLLCFYIAEDRFVYSSFKVLNWHWLLSPVGSYKKLLKPSFRNTQTVHSGKNAGCILYQYRQVVKTKRHDFSVPFGIFLCRIELRYFCDVVQSYGYVLAIK